MKKKVLIIANNDGLSGVTNDISNVKSFLTSLEGGAWNHDEIEVLLNPSKAILELTITLDRLNYYDFYLVVFTGHGYSNQRKTYLAINKSEFIEENLLHTVSSKQISIYDCCRAVGAVSFAEKSVTLEARFDSIGFSREAIRAAYENRISKSPPQQLYFYSCQIGEYSLETNGSALYLTKFLEAAIEFSETDASQPFKLATEANNIAAPRVSSMAKSKGISQNPDYVIPKLPSSQQLPISINPNDFILYRSKF